MHWQKRIIRGGSRTAAISKMEHFVIIVNGWKPLTIITKRSILNATAVLNPPVITEEQKQEKDKGDKKESITRKRVRR